MSVLKKHLLKPVEVVFLVKDESMADEVDLLWSVRWIKNEIFSDIIRRFVNKCHRSGIGTTVFDKYNSPTKKCYRRLHIVQISAIGVDVTLNEIFFGFI